MSDWYHVLGYVAGFVLAFQQLPQIVHIWVTRSANDVSFVWLLMSVFGTSLMSIYGWLDEDMPVLASTLVSTFITLVTMISKIIVDKENIKVSDGNV